MFYILLTLISCSTTVLGELYNSTDPLVILDVNNFHQELIGSPNGWIIEFYNSWCGHCINFAPTWRQFSKEVKDWNHTIKVGVIDCSVGPNIPICRDYEVMAYPSIRMFGAFTKKGGDIGKDAKNLSVDGLQEIIIHFIAKKQSEGLGAESWVNLLSYDQPIENIFKYAPPKAEHAVLIVEDRKTLSSGSYTIMDLGIYPMVYARRTQDTNVLSSLGDTTHTTFPAIVLVSRSGKRQILDESVKSREEMTALIMKHLKLSKKLSLVNTLNSVGKSKVESRLSEGEDDREGAGDGKPEEISSDRLNYDDDLPDSAYRHPNKDQVYMVDMENAISYSLRSEVALHQVIAGDHLDALRAFLTALVDYLPARPQLHEFLAKLNLFVAKAEDKLTAEDLEKAIHFLTSQSSVLPDQQAWVGCKGSTPGYRGYPCGLWTLFHTLTVNAVIKHSKDKTYDPHQPLKAIYKYVKNFFSCEECSKHFQEMYILDAESSVQAPNDEIVWLWNAHNKANKRLAGDLSEDPKHPKIQFPSKSSCPSCWKGENFNKIKVISYLKTLYGRGSLSLVATQDLSYLEKNVDNRQKMVMDALGEKFFNRNNINFDKKVTIQKMNSWNFNSMDVNLCIVLYLCSTVVIVSGYLMFLLKRRFRRKIYLDNYKIT